MGEGEDRETGKSVRGEQRTHEARLDMALLLRNRSRVVMPELLMEVLEQLDNLLLMRIGAQHPSSDEVFVPRHRVCEVSANTKSRLS